MRGPLKWHGGKAYLAARIVERMPRHRHYVEPYAGGASVLLARDPDDEALWWGKGSSDRGVSEVLNDLNGPLMNFWSCLQHPRIVRTFLQALECTPFGRKSFEEALERAQRPCELAWPTPCLACAVTFFVLCRQSLAGRCKVFTPLTRKRTRRAMNGNVSEYLGAIEGLPEVHERLRPVVLESLPALDVIRREDTPETLFYCDPTYLHPTRATTGEYGAFEMTLQQHEELLCRLLECRGKVMLSGYPHELYDAYLKAWRCERFELPNNAAGGKVKRRMIECLWMNY